MDYPGSLRADDVYIYNYLDKTKQVRKELPANSYIVTENDELNRVKSVTYLEGRSVKYYYDGVGRLLKTTETSSTQTTEIAYEYDLTGNVKKAKHTYNGNVYEVSYSYDEKGNVTGITYPGGYSVGYEYDAYGRVINVPQFVQSGGSIPGVKYKANGFMEEIRYVNGITTAFTDDSLGRIQRISNPVFNLTYGYDGKGNITSITGSNGTAVASTYSYSDNGWLKEARQGQNVYSYIYDSAGNCTTKTINGVQTSYGYASNELNLLTSVNGNGVTYDKMGNMTGRIDIGCGYTYDQSNRLTGVMKNGQDVGRYYYNSEGKRYQKVENGESAYYIYSGESLLYELKPDGTKVYYIYLNGKQIAKVEGGKKYFYHTDHLGSTRAITDDQGNVVERFEYQPFGAEESTVTGDDTLTFTGKMQDDPTGLMYFNARYYDPTLGRFITEDSRNDGINWYVYCHNRPLTFIDHDGNLAEMFSNTYQHKFTQGDFPKQGFKETAWRFLTSFLTKDAHWSAGPTIDTMFNLTSKSGTRRSITPKIGDIYTATGTLYSVEEQEHAEGKFLLTVHYVLKVTESYDWIKAPINQVDYLIGFDGNGNICIWGTDLKFTNWEVFFDWFDYCFKQGNYYVERNGYSNDADREKSTNSEAW